MRATILRTQNLAMTEYLVPPSLRESETNEAIHNVAKQKPLQWNLTSKIPCYRLPRKSEIFSQ